VRGLIERQPGQWIQLAGNHEGQYLPGLWAEAGWELHEPWLEYHARGGFVPFGQIHGHSAIVRYADQT
jgi:hypothetical protein